MQSDGMAWHRKLTARARENWLRLESAKTGGDKGTPTSVDCRIAEKRTKRTTAMDDDILEMLAELEEQLNGCQTASRLKAVFTGSAHEAPNGERDQRVVALETLARVVGANADPAGLAAPRAIAKLGLALAIAGQSVEEGADRKAALARAVEAAAGSVGGDGDEEDFVEYAENENGEEVEAVSGPSGKRTAPKRLFSADKALAPFSAPGFLAELADAARGAGEALWPQTRAALAELLRLAAVAAGQAALRDTLLREGAGTQGGADAFEKVRDALFGERSALAEQKTLSSELAQEGLTEETWHDGIFEELSSEGSRWWPTDESSAQDLDRMWSVMQACDGAARRRWEAACKGRWAEFGKTPWERRNGGREECATPKSVLAPLFSSCAWRWLEAVPSAAPDAPFETFLTAESLSQKRLSPDEAFWRCAFRPTPPEAGLDETLEQLERIYGWGGENSKAGRELGRAAVDNDGVFVQTWPKKLAQHWSTNACDARVGPGALQRAAGRAGDRLARCEGLERAWFRIIRWLDEPFAQRERDEWLTLYGPVLGFGREARRQYPEAWAAVSRRDCMSVIGAIIGWPMIWKRTSDGLATNLAEWLALQGEADLAEETIAQGGQPIRQGWIEALSRWARVDGSQSAWEARMAPILAIHEKLLLGQQAGGQKDETASKTTGAAVDGEGKPAPESSARRL
jgi:hypothetical protein